MKRFAAIVLASTIALDGPCAAAITWWVDPGGANVTVTPGTAPHYTVTFADNSVDATVFFRGSANDNLALTVNNNSSSKSLHLDIGHLNQGGGQTLGSLTSMIYASPNDRPIVIDSLETTGDVLDIVGSRIVSAVIGGDLGVSSSSTSGGVQLFTPVSGSGSIASLVVEGDLLGNIAVPGGGMDFLQVLGAGGIGESAIRKEITTRDAIKHIDVPNGSIYADIRAVGGSAPDIGRIFADGGIHQKSSIGITCRKFDDLASPAQPGIRIPNGDLDANVTLSAALDREIIVGGAFASGRTIALPAVSGANGGLRNQITFNNLGASHDWDGSITIGGTALSSQPYYTNTAASIGGGAAGLALFNMHDSSCTPPNGSMIAIRQETLIGGCVDVPLVIKLKFYGPVIVNDPPPPPANPTPPIYVWEYVGGITQWQKVDWEIDVVLDSADSFERTVKVTWTDSADPPLGLFKFTRKSDRISCQGVGGDDEHSVDDFEYIFELVDACEFGLLANFDLNSDSTVSADDVPVQIASPADLNQDNAINTGDLAALLNAIDTYQSLPN